MNHGLENVFPFVVNTYIKFERRFPSILILDEVHNYASEEFGKVFEIAGIEPINISVGKIPFVLGLTATLERNDGKHRFIEEYCPVIDTVTLEEAKREGYISKFKTYNWGLEFNAEDREKYNRWHDIFNSSFAKFNHDFKLAMACSLGRDARSQLTVPIKVQRRDHIGNLILIEEMTTVWKTSAEWCVYFAGVNGWDGTIDHPWSPKQVSSIAQQFSTAMRERKQMIYTATIKIDAIEQLVDKFKVKTITFGEDSNFADAIVERLGEERCKSYHSKTKGISKRVEVISKKGVITYKDKKIGAKVYKAMILSMFEEEDSFQVLSTVKALDEGMDNEKVIMGIQASYTSTKRQNTQRTGRATRKDTGNLGDDKMALNINLYIKDTQEFKWLNDKQRGIKDIEWVDSIDEINLEESEEENFSLV